jgi:hypothetical protein
LYASRTQPAGARPADQSGSIHPRSTAACRIEGGHCGA